MAGDNIEDGAKGQIEFDKDEPGNDEDSTEDIDDSEIVVGTTKRRLRCHLANINDLCFIDIAAHGRAMIEKENLMVTRCRKGKRNTCMIKFYEKVYDKSTTTDGVDVIETMFDHFRNKLKEFNQYSPLFLSL